MRAYGPERPSPKHIIRHLDGDPGNFSLENLAWGTLGKNREDDARHGRTNAFPKKGSKRQASTYFSEEELRAVIARADAKAMSVADLLREVTLKHLEEA